ncbi:MAG: DUF4007 family protein [Leptolyngbyaceae cyanobacterium bins.349]|nr:DUF4007 family protein [Leptolyngbyaceae cyanobacterium bins.349]
MGWLNAQGLTPEGQLVATKDPYLETTVTDWVMHYHCSVMPGSLWHYLVYQFFPEHQSFTQDELISHCTDHFLIESKEALKKSLKLILKTYTKEDAIAKSKFIILQQKQFSIGHPELSNIYTTSYLLAKFWEQYFPSVSSVLVDRILEHENSFCCVLGITQDLLREQLETLAEHGIIELRSAKPSISGTKPPIKEKHETVYQVYRCWDSPLELLERAYENDIATPNRPLSQSLGAILDDEDNSEFLQFLEWAIAVVSFEGGSNTIVKLAS